MIFGRTQLLLVQLVPWAAPTIPFPVTIAPKGPTNLSFLRHFLFGSFYFYDGTSFLSVEPSRDKNSTQAQSCIYSIVFLNPYFGRFLFLIFKGRKKSFSNRLHWCLSHRARTDSIISVCVSEMRSFTLLFILYTSNTKMRIIQSEM